MGYSATLLNITTGDNPSGYDLADGDPLLLLAANLPAVWTALEHAEQDSGIGHISWVNDPLAIERPRHASLADAVASVLHQYGWDGTYADPDTGDVHLGWWGGDKLGSCWDQITAAIAQGIDPALRVTWYLHGEDSDLWCEILHAGTVRSYGVILSPDRGPS